MVIRLIPGRFGLSDTPRPVESIHPYLFADMTRDVKSSRPKWPRGQNFGHGLGLEHLASAWPRSAAEEPAVKKRLISLFADYRTSHNDTVSGSR